jgi:hypothetical protein
LMVFAVEERFGEQGRRQLTNLTRLGLRVPSQGRRRPVELLLGVADVFDGDAEPAGNGDNGVVLDVEELLGGGQIDVVGSRPRGSYRTYAGPAESPCTTGEGRQRPAGDAAGDRVAAQHTEAA